MPVVRHTGGLKDTVFDVDYDKERAAWELYGSTDWMRDGVDATNGFAFEVRVCDNIQLGVQGRRLERGRGLKATCGWTFKVCSCVLDSMGQGGIRDIFLSVEGVGGWRLRHLRFLSSSVMHAFAADTNLRPTLQRCRTTYMPTEPLLNVAVQGTDAMALDYALNRAIDAYYNDRAWFHGLQRRVMEQDWTWNRPALDYIELYFSAIKGV